MKCLALVVAACGASTTPRPAARTTVPAGALVLEHVSVVPMDREIVLPDQDVVIDGDKIVAVVPAAQLTTLPASVTRRDLRGKFVMPGLADMHAHAVDDDDLQLYLAAGTTQLRLMNWSEDAVGQRERVATGKLDGPSIEIEGQITDGDPPVWPWSIAVKTKEDVDRVIAWHVEQHLPAIKVYERLPLELYDAIVAGARAHGLRIVGHVSESVGLPHALDSKQDSIEHLEGYAAYLSGETKHFADAGHLDILGSVALWDRADVAKMPEIAKRTKAAGTWNCPTLVVYDRLTQSDTPPGKVTYPGAQYVSPMKRRGWDDSRLGTHEQFATAHAALKNARAMVLALHQAGAGLLVGTDSNNPGIVPGFSVLDELDLFVQAGVPRFATLRASTSGASEFLGGNFGVIGAGRRADLLVLAANPLDDFATLREPIAVIARGKWHDHAEMIAELEARVPYFTGEKSVFDGLPARPVEGTRELTARYRSTAGDLLVEEQRVSVDKRSSDRVISAESSAGYAVRIEDRDGSGSVLVIDGSGESQRVERDHGKLIVTKVGGQPASMTDPGGLLGGLSLAPDWLWYGEAMKLAVGKSVKLQIVSFGFGADGMAIPMTLERKPDATHAVLGSSATVRVFEIKALGQVGSILLDASGALVEQTFAGETTVRVE